MRVERVPPVRNDFKDVIAQARSHLSHFEGRIARGNSDIRKLIRLTEARIAHSRELMAQTDEALRRFYEVLRGERPPA
jgi:hypothetical protein